MKKGIKMEKEKFTLEVNYSEDAIKNKLMRFSTPSGDAFEISADEMATILVGQVNSEQLEAAFVESDRVNVVEVERQLKVRLDRDFKKGEEIRLTYAHPYPVEFALIEEAAKIAKIKMDVPRMELSKEYLDSVRDKITPYQRRFVQAVYQFFKGLLSKPVDGSS